MLKIVDETFEDFKLRKKLDWNAEELCAHCGAILSISKFEENDRFSIAEWDGKHSSECPEGVCFIKGKPKDQEELAEAFSNIIENN